MIVEKYRLTLTHTIESDGKILKVEEPKVMEVLNTNMEDRFVIGYKNYLINQLFDRLRQEVLQEEQMKGEQNE